MLILHLLLLLLMSFHLVRKTLVSIYHLTFVFL
nr:MAG TPA: hypothetical protein [Caudoviricetes sp.]